MKIPEIKILLNVSICVVLTLSMLMTRQRLAKLLMTTATLKSLPMAVEYVGWELDPNQKPGGRTENTTYPKICNPQPMWSNQSSAKLIKMNHDETGINTTNFQHYFNYATANYSALREEATVDETLEVPKRNTAGNASPPKWELKSKPKIYNAAVCKMLPFDHFAHMMEEIWRCFDYWMEFAINNSLETIMARPVLIYHTRPKKNDPVDIGFKRTSFMRGVRNFLGTQIGLKVMTVNEYFDCHLRHHKIGKSDSIFGNITKLLCDEIYHPNQTVRTIKRFQNGYVFENVHKWNILTDRYLVKNNERNNITRPTVTSNKNVCSRPPRIRILNRKRTRNVLNSEYLAQDLSNMKYFFVSRAPHERKNDNQENFNTTAHKQPVTVMYFENKDFAEQIRFFRNTDILISPHGAQLTGLPFMANGNSATPSFNISDATASGKSDVNVLPASCKQVLELFPQNYAIPFFFGSLAVQSGLSHSYVYFDNYSINSGRPPRVVMPWERVSAPTMQEREASRRSNFCPRRDDFISYVAELVMDWYRCHGCI